MKNIYGILSSSPKVAKNPNNVASYTRGEERGERGEEEETPGDPCVKIARESE
jgi:hypothetical protein